MTDGVRYSDFSPLPADQLSGDEKFVGLKDGVNVRLEGDWRGPMADLLRPYFGLGNLASINGSTVGLEFAQLPTPGDASWARVNDDGTVSLRTAAQTLSDLGASSGMSNPMTTAGDLIVGGASGAPERLGIGSNGQVLSVSGGGLSWEDAGTAANALYRGPWEAQTGQAVPPFWVDYGGGENLLLESEGLNDGSAWSRFNLEPPVDSGIPAPIINGRSFGNYYTVTASATTGNHALTQIFSTPMPNGEVSFLVRANGLFDFSPQMRDVGGNGLSPIPVSISWDLAENQVIGTASGYDAFDVENLGGGDFLVRGKWSNKVGLQSLRIYLLGPVGGFSFTGNGVDGILVTRVQVATPNARYIKTTDAPAPYTPPNIYELQAPVDAIENEDDPITDGGTLWKEVGSGGSGGGATGPYSIVPAVELSADDQDGSGNIAVTLDLSEGTVWTIDCTNSPLMSTNGNINVTVTGLPEDPNTGITFQVYFKQAGRKGVNWTLPAGVTASWAGTQSYGADSSSVDVVQGYWLSTEPDIMHLSVIDKR